MNRVWKKFFLKISKGILVIAYVLSVMIIPGFIFQYFGYSPELGTLFGSVMFIIVPMGCYILRDIYKDAKFEVERENREMLRAIKGGDY